MSDSLPLHKRYGTKGNPGLPCKTNHIVLSKANSFEHEFMKCLVAIAHFKGYDVDGLFSETDFMCEVAKTITKVEAMLKPWENVVGNDNFITEAEDKFTGRVRDIVLDTGLVIEICYKNDSVGVRKQYEKDGVMMVRL